MIVRKYIHVILATLILVSNIGLAFNVHYCGGSIASISLVSFSKEIRSKDCCGKEIEKSSCCKDKKVQFQKKSDNSIFKSISFQLEIPFLDYHWKPYQFNAVATIKSAPLVRYCCNANAPPLYQLYSQYIYYA